MVCKKLNIMLQSILEKISFESSLFYLYSSLFYLYSSLFYLYSSLFYLYSSLFYLYSSLFIQFYSTFIQFYSTLFIQFYSTFIYSILFYLYLFNFILSLFNFILPLFKCVLPLFKFFIYTLDKFDLVQIQLLMSCTYNFILCNLIQAHQLESVPAPCDKKNCSEHQTLFLVYVRESGHETSIVSSTCS